MINGFVKGQSLKLMHPLTVADTVDYLEAKFYFQSAEWNGLAKWAHFRQGDKVYDVMLKNGRIERTDHLNLSAGNWDVYLHGNGEGGVRVTTELQRIRVAPTGVLEGELLPEVPLSTAEQISAVAASALELAQSVRHDADSGALDGHTPERGVDYWTAADRADVVDEARQGTLDAIGEVIAAAETATEGATAAGAEADSSAENANAAAARAEAAAESLSLAIDAASRAESAATAAEAARERSLSLSEESAAAAQYSEYCASAADKSAKEAAASVAGGAYVTVFVGEDGNLYLDKTDNLTDINFTVQNGNLYMEVIY